MSGLAQDFATERLTFYKAELLHFSALSRDAMIIICRSNTVLLLLCVIASVTQSWAFRTTVFSATVAVRSSLSFEPLRLNRDCDNEGFIIASDISEDPWKRRDFLLQSLRAASIISSASSLSLPSITNAAEDYIYERGAKDDLTSQLYNPDGTLKDPTMAEAKETTVNLSFMIPSNTDSTHINIAIDGIQSTSSSVSDDVAATNVKAFYNLPIKWKRNESPQLPPYYDASEGKNGQACNRITVYSISTPNNLDMNTLEKASKVGVAKSLFMDQISNNYFDKGVQKSDLIGGRTVRKPIQSMENTDEMEEQIYYEFDLAFAPSECPDYMAGNKENLGLGFCPYDRIFLVSATVLTNNDSKDKIGTLMCFVVECDKEEWKMANSDLRRVRSSYKVQYA